MKARGRFLLAFGAAVASGVLTTVSVEHRTASGLGWVAFVPVLVPLLLFKEQVAPAILAGGVFGAVRGGFLFGWLITDGRWAEWAWVMLSHVLAGLLWSWLVWRFGQLPAPELQPTPARKAGRQRPLAPILPGAGGGADAWQRSIGHLRLAMFVSASWTVVEWGQGVVLPAWNPVGLAVAANLPLLQLVQSTGPAGLSTMLVFANVIVLTSIRRLVREPGRISWAGRFDVTATLAVIFLGALTGFYSLTHRVPPDPLQQVMCAAAKGGAAGSLTALSAAAGPTATDLIVWREVKFTPADYQKLAELGIGKTGALVSGVLGDNGRGLVGARTVLPGLVTNLYAPLNNAPFFVPFGAPPNRNLSPFRQRGVNWVTFLNWQAGSPPVLRAALPSQAQGWIVLFDPPGHSRRAGRQLRENLRVWAVAYGRALIFSGRGAGSLLQAPTGRLVAQTGEQSRESVAGQVPVASAQTETLYARLGDWWPVATGILTLVFALGERLKRSRAASPRRLRP
ncbi:MAG TPA: hypothetical protein VGD78_18290 [Chthoniobacterales bacterium]